MTGELIPTGVTFGVGRNSINDAFSGTAYLNNISLDSGANFSAGTGGGIIYSAGTDLYNIFSTGSGDVTRVQPGTNISTGGTDNFPTVNLDANISLTSIQTTQGFSGGQNSDVASYIGRAVIGFGRFSDFAWFSHIDSNTSSGYALIQGPDGSTTINATLSGTGIGFRLDNGGTDYMRISGNTGYVGLFENTPTERLHLNGSIRMVDGSEGVGKTIVDVGDGKMQWSAVTRVVDPVINFGTTAGTISWDVTDSSNAKVILSGNVTLSVNGATSGAYGTIKLVQDSVGSHTLTFGAGTHLVVNGGSGSVTLTSTPNSVDIISFFYDGSEFNWSAGYNYT